MTSPPSSPDVTFDVLEGTVTKSGEIVRIRPVELVLLTVLAGRRVGLSRPELHETVFPHLEYEAARASLKVSICRIRRQLGKEAIATLGDGYRLQCRIADRLDEVEADLWQWRHLGRTLNENEVESAKRRYEKLRVRRLKSPRGARWPEAYEHRFLALETAMLDILARDAIDRSDFEAALVFGREVQRLDPFDEAACEIIVIALKRLGRNSSARAAAQSYATLIARELGVASDDRLLALAM